MLAPDQKHASCPHRDALPLCSRRGHWTNENAVRKAFRKLGVKSRHQLKQHVLQSDADIGPAAGAH
jgi:hypothetical protein